MKCLYSMFALEAVGFISLISLNFFGSAFTTVRLSTSTTSSPSSTNSRTLVAGRGISYDMSTCRSSKKNNLKRTMTANSISNDGHKGEELLSLPARPGRPLKVIIAGGGVGGLTTALCMLKKGFQVRVYEKTAAFARFGGPIQFASNALSVLKEIDDTLFTRVMDKFTFTGTRTCGIKDGLRADGSFRMTQDSIDYLFNKEAPADWFVKFPLKQCADLFGLPYTGVIDRPDLQEILIEECKKLDPDFIRNGNPVVSYQQQQPQLDGAAQGSTSSTRGVTVTLADGQTDTADILVGADGIWSAVRAQMYGEEVKKSTANKKRRQGCTYSGYTVFAGETILSTPDYYETGYKVYIYMYLSRQFMKEFTIPTFLILWKTTLTTTTTFFPSSFSCFYHPSVSCIIYCRYILVHNDILLLPMLDKDEYNGMHFLLYPLERNVLRQDGVL
jgi:hypothetical protein